MNSLEKNMHNASSEQNRDTPPTEGVAKKIPSKEVDRLKTLSKKIIDAVSNIPTKNIPRKIALVALTFGALHISTEKAFGAESHTPVDSQPSHAAESVTPQEKAQPLEFHPPDYAYTKQKQLFDRLFLDKEKVIPMMEKQGLILTQMSIEAKNAVVHFDELKNGAYTVSVLIRAVDKDTLEISVCNSNQTEDIILFRDGSVISAFETKSE